MKFRRHLFPFQTLFPLFPSFLLLLDTEIQYPSLRVYVAHINVDLSSRGFLAVFVGNKPMTSGLTVPRSIQLS